MLVRVKVKAGARKERFVETAPGKFEVDVKEKAEQNMANDRIRALIARRLGVSIKFVHIISGQRRKNKTFRVIK